MNSRWHREVGGRRKFLVQASAATAAMAGLGADAGGKPRVAAVFTQCHHRSHAHVVLENFLAPYVFNGRRTEPGAQVVSFYADQFPAKDMARAIARTYGIPIYPTIAAALRRGGRQLAVDAVLLIGEHGNYPVNAKGQSEYPRKRFFDETVAVLKADGRVVPVFSDKHLSYRWDWAKEMYDTARALGIPFMAGSSVPLAQRRPSLELPVATKVVEAVAIHSGPFEVYDFHGLEVLQSLVEARSGGETGIDRVQMLSGEALWQAADAGRWSVALADAAMAAELGPGQPTLRKLVQTAPFNVVRPTGILVHYRDGLRGVVLKVGKHGTRWNFACRLAGAEKPLATTFHGGPWRNRCFFMALAHAIQRFFQDRRALYPVERTLLTTGALAAAVDSHHQGGRALTTPHLRISYAAADFRAVREMGATWKTFTDDLPEPQGIHPLPPLR